MAVAHHPPQPVSTRHWLGFRRPGRLALAVFRLPLLLYRNGKGGLLGHTFLMFVHVGRVTGTPHEATAMVLRFDPTTNEAVICSAWGPDADWVRNLRRRPALRAQIGSVSFTPDQRFLGEDEAVAVVGEFCRDHPYRARLITTLLGWGDMRCETDVREVARTRPFIAFRPCVAALLPPHHDERAHR